MLLLSPKKWQTRCFFASAELANTNFIVIKEASEFFIDLKSNSFSSF